MNFKNSVTNVFLKFRDNNVYTKQPISFLKKKVEPFYKKYMIGKPVKTKYNGPNKKVILQNIQSSEISRFLNELSYLSLNKCFDSRLFPDTSFCFVVDPTVAQDIVKKILPYIQDESSIVLETNPGLGLITYNLIKANLQNITIFVRPYYPKLGNELFEKYSHVVKTIGGNIFNYGKHNEDLIRSYLNFAYEQGKTIKIVGVAPKFSFFSLIISQFIISKSWSISQSIEFFVVMTESAVKQITGKLQTRFTTYCLIHLLYKFEVIEEYPRVAFLPHYSKFEKSMFLVKLTKNPKCFDKIKIDEIEKYIKFLLVLDRNNDTFVIPTLESLIPGVGPLLIKKGLSIQNQVVDLNASDSVALFRICSELDDFRILDSVVPAYGARYSTLLKQEHFDEDLSL